MGKEIKLDSDVLSQLAQSLAAAAQVLSCALTAPPEPTEPPKVPKRRGRPPKAKPSERLVKDLKSLLPANTEVIEIDENVDEIINEPAPPPKPRSKETFSPKQFRTEVTGTATAGQDVTKGRGPMKFIDVKGVPKNDIDLNWEPTERRAPKQKMDFTCSKCGCKFSDYPSNVPQAFIKERIAGIAEGSPLVKCDNCIAL